MWSTFWSSEVKEMYTYMYKIRDNKNYCNIKNKQRANTMQSKDKLILIGEKWEVYYRRAGPYYTERQFELALLYGTTGQCGKSKTLSSDSLWDNFWTTIKWVFWYSVPKFISFFWYSSNQLFSTFLNL